jgi:hypothetical protein
MLPIVFCHAFFGVEKVEHREEPGNLAEPGTPRGLCLYCDIHVLEWENILRTPVSRNGK